MEFQEIFEEYYTQLRGDSDVPDHADPEWVVAVRYGNAAIRRWLKVETEYWDELWTDTTTQGETITFDGVALDYPAPSNMDYFPRTTNIYEGNFISMRSATDTGTGTGYFRMPIISPGQRQQFASLSTYAYFTGDPNTGFTLHLHGVNAQYTNWLINFPYYRKPTYFDRTSDGNGGVNEDGTTVSECPDPSFIINYMLMNRFRAERNYPALQTAQEAAETALQGMQLRNNHGINIPDNEFGRESGAIFGI